MTDNFPLDDPRILNHHQYQPKTQMPSPEDRRMGGFRGVSDSNDTFPLTDADNIDYLATKYPLLKDRIQLLRNTGISDERIQSVIETHVEPRLNFVANQDKVNQFLGRTPETIKAVADHEHLMLMNNYKKAFPDASDDDIFNAIGVSQFSGISAANLLRYPKVYKAITDLAIAQGKASTIREGIIEAGKRGMNNYLVQRKIAGIGYQQWEGMISDEEADKQVAELEKQITPEPLVHTRLTDAINGAAGITTQGYSTMGKGILVGAGTGTLGAITGGLVAGGAGAVQGAKTGFHTGFMLAQVNELFQLQAGDDYRRIIKLKDENGQPIDRNAAKMAAALSGAVTVLTELGAWQYTAKLFPGLSALSGIGSETIIQAVQHNPVVREGLANLAIDTTKGITLSSINNTIESVNTDLAPWVAQMLSGQPFPQFDASGIIPRAKETFTRSVRDFSAAAIPGMLWKGFKIFDAGVQYNNTIRDIARNEGSTVQQVEADIFRMRKEVEHSLSQSKTGENNTDIETDTNNKQQDTQDINTPQQQQLQHPDYVYFPRKKIQDAGITPAFTAHDEAALTWEQYQQLKQDNIELATELANQTRLGASGSTIEEIAERMQNTDQDLADAYHSDDNQALIERKKQEYQQIMPEEQAQDLATVLGYANAASLARNGVPLTDITITTQEQEQTRLNDFSRLNPEYDIKNPDTWTNQERAQRVREIDPNAKLTDWERLLKQFLDTWTGRNKQKSEQENETQQESLQDTSLKSVFRDEFNDFVQTVKNANHEAIDTLAAKSDLDTDRYEINSSFPKGKTLNPDRGFEFHSFGGTSKIDFAIDGQDLKVRIKVAGNRSPLVISIKDFKNADFRQIIQDLTGGFTPHNFQISEAPIAQYLARSLSQFWNENNIPKTKTFGGMDTIERGNVDVLGGMDTVERTNADVLGGMDTVERTNADVLGGMDTVEKANADVLGGMDTVEKANADVLGGMDTVEKANADVLGGKFEPIREINTHGGKIQPLTKEDINVHNGNTDRPLTFNAPNDFMNPPVHTSEVQELLDEDHYSPDTQENNAVLQDTPEQHIPDVAPETLAQIQTQQTQPQVQTVNNSSNTLQHAVSVLSDIFKQNGIDKENTLNNFRKLAVQSGIDEQTFDKVFNFLQENGFIYVRPGLSHEVMITPRLEDAINFINMDKQQIIDTLRNNRVEDFAGYSFDSLDFDASFHTSDTELLPIVDAINNMQWHGENTADIEKDIKTQVKQILLPISDNQLLSLLNENNIFPGNMKRETAITAAVFNIFNRVFDRDNRALTSRDRLNQPSKKLLHAVDYVIDDINNLNNFLSQNYDKTAQTSDTQKQNEITDETPIVQGLPNEVAQNLINLVYQDKTKTSLASMSYIYEYLARYLGLPYNNDNEKRRARYVIENWVDDKRDERKATGNVDALKLEHIPPRFNGNEAGSFTFTYRENKQSNSKDFSVTVFENTNPLHALTRKVHGALLQINDSDGNMVAMFSPYSDVLQLSNKGGKTLDEISKNARKQFEDQLRKAIPDLLKKAGMLDSNGKLIPDGYEQFRALFNDYWKRGQIPLDVIKDYNWDNFNPDDPITWPDVPEKKQAIDYLNTIQGAKEDNYYSIAAQQRLNELKQSLPEKYKLSEAANLAVQSLQRNSQQQKEQVQEQVQVQETTQQEVIPQERDTSNRDLMPPQARFNLAIDEQNWRNTVDNILNDDSVTVKSNKNIPVMHTPLVFTLVGAKHLPLRMRNGKLKQILRDHPGMTPDILKSIVGKLADPVAIFQSKSENGHPAVVALLDINDPNGAPINAVLHLDYKGNINKLATYFGKDNSKDGSPNNQFFANEVDNGRLLYINRDKAKQWADHTGVQLIEDGIATNAKTEQDLLNLWHDQNNEQKGYYKLDENGNPLARTYFAKGKAVIEILNATKGAGNISTHIHEIGHVLFDMMPNLAQQGSIQMEQDFQTILDHAGVTRDEWNADTNSQKGGAREKAHEWFANAFEVYLSEGKAPSKGLKAVFERIRNWLLDIYSDINNQLGIQLDDDVRQVFDRLLTMQGDESNVADYVQQEVRVQQQIREYKKMLAAEKEQQEKEYQEYLANEDEREFKHQKQQDFLQQVHQSEPDLAQHYDDTFRLAQEMGIDTYHLDPEALSDVVGYIQAQEEYNAKTAGRKKFGKNKQVDAVYKAIRDLGFISGDDAKRILGEDKAKQIAKRWTRLWSGKTHGKGQPLQFLADKLASMFPTDFAPDIDNSTGEVTASSLQKFTEWLENAQRTYKLFEDVQPAIQVNEDTLDALLAAFGSKGTIDYLKDRKDFLLSRTSENHETEIADIDRYLDELQDKPAKKAPKKKKKNITSVDLRQAAKKGYSLGREVEREVQDTKRKIADTISNENFKSKIAALKDKQAERIGEIREQAKLKAQELREAQGETRRSNRRINMLQQRINTLQNFLTTRSQKQQISKWVNGITRMAKGKSISYARLQDIQQLLDGYNLKRQGISKRNAIREFLDLKQLPDTDADFEQQAADAGITQQDVEQFLDKVHIEDMSLDDVHSLFEHVKSIYRQGREEFIQWQLQREQRRTELHKQMADTLIATTKTPETRVIKDKEDIKRRFAWGMENARRYWDAVQTPGRFLEGLGESFRRILDDGFTQRRGEAYSHIHDRHSYMLQQLQQLGVRFQNLSDNAITLDGQTYSFSNVMAIYAGMKNPKSAAAILWGNFVSNAADRNKPYSTTQEGLNAINKILEFINLPENQKYKQAADLIIQDFDSNFDRINDAHIRDFNSGMNKEDNYTPMFRLRHQSNQGLIDAETEQLGLDGNAQQLLKKVADNFTISRENINPDMQQPIDLNLWGNWSNAVVQQEFSAALGGYASDVVSALLLRGDNGSVQELIKQRLGAPDWDTLRSIFNNSINDNDFLEQNAIDGITKNLVKSRSIVYVAGRLSTALAQMSSYPLALRYAIRGGHIFRSLFKGIDMAANGRWHEFLENVYQKSPELRYTYSDPIDKSVQQGLWNNRLNIKNNTARKAINAYKQAIEWGYKGVQILDNWTKSMVFDAVYNSEIEQGKSEQDAIRLANRAVHDTQPASTLREMPRINSQSQGVMKLIFTQFMGALAPVFNMSVVDTARNLASPSWNSVKATAVNMIGVALSIYFAGAVKDAFNGKLPSHEELPDGSQDDWPHWFGSTLIDNLISTVPILNRFYEAGMVGLGKRYRFEDRLTEPFSALGKAINYKVNPKFEGQYNQKAMEQAVKGFALLGIPFPYAGVRDFLRFFGVGEKAE